MTKPRICGAKYVQTKQKLVEKQVWRIWDPQQETMPKHKRSPKGIPVSDGVVAYHTRMHIARVLVN